MKVLNILLQHTFLFKKKNPTLQKISWKKLLQNLFVYFSVAPPAVSSNYVVDLRGDFSFFLLMQPIFIHERIFDAQV